MQQGQMTSQPEADSGEAAHGPQRPAGTALSGPTVGRSFGLALGRGPAFGLGFPG